MCLSLQCGLKVNNRQNQLAELIGKEYVFFMSVLNIVGLSVKAEA